MIVKKGIAKVVLIGNEKEIKSLAGDIDLEGVMIEDSLNPKNWRIMQIHCMSLENRRV